MRLRVEDVGRDRITFEVDALEHPDAMEDAIIKGIRSRKALMSRDIEVWSNKDHTEGFIVAGVRRVGRWRRVAE